MAIVSREFNTTVRAQVLRQLKRDYPDLTDIEDVLQEAIFRLLIQKIQPNNEQETTAWLIVVARNLIRDQYRHSNTFPSLPLEESDSYASSTYYQEFDLLSDIHTRTVFARLNHSEQVLISLRLQGYSCPEIAIALGRTEETVKKRLQRLRGRMDLLALDET
jgi:RNA polymerase sigma factor (sigma-70 family)